MPGTRGKEHLLSTKCFHKYHYTHYNPILRAGQTEAEGGYIMALAQLVMIQILGLSLTKSMHCSPHSIPKAKIFGVCPKGVCKQK